MPSTPHLEKHFTATETVRDIVIGMSDGLTVPFALAAGVSGAGAGTALIITAGLAEIAAGSIAMGLGGYLAGRTDVDHYESERQREIDETFKLPDKEREEVEDILVGYGLPKAEAAPVVEALSRDQNRWVEFMMRFELGLEKPDPKRAGQSALTIAISYIAGGFIPLSPYMLYANVQTALTVSVIVTLIALFLFGFFKGRFTGINPLRGGLQTMLVGGLAAGAAFLIARWIG
jgi:VIT1/CCC1 family predicted Fe2+/Mn2+ transporter